MGRSTLLSAVAACAGLLGLACEPASITEARNQLARGGERITRLTVPLVNDSVAVVEFLPETDTVTVNGLVGIKFDPDSVAVDVGTKLQFSNVNTTRVLIDVPAASLTVGGNFPIPATSYAPLAGEPRILALDSIVAETGNIVITTFNRLPATLNYTVTLDGFRDANGIVLSRTSTVPASPGGGAYSSATMVFNLAGVTISPGTVSATLTGNITVPPGTNTAWADSAFIQSGNGAFSVRRLKGSLNPSQTPELTFAIENGEELLTTSVDFADFEDAVRASTLNNAVASLGVVNTSQAPLVISNFRLGAVRLNASGQLMRDGLGNLIYEKNGSGTNILLAVADPGQSTLTIARGSSKALSYNAAALIDRIAHLLLDDVRVALVATGSASVGDGATSTIVRADLVKVRFQLNVGLDITVPPAGVVFTRTQIVDGADLESGDADELGNRVMQALASARVRNSTPFGVVVQLALVEDVVASNVDVFTLPNRVLLDSVVLRAPTVNASGVVITPTTDSVGVGISGTDARLLFGKKFSAALRIRLVPGAGGGGRGALRVQDRVVISARTLVDVRTGGGL